MPHVRIPAIRPIVLLALLSLLASVTAVWGRRDDDRPPAKKSADKGPRTEEMDEHYQGGKPVLRVEEADVVEKTGRLFPRPEPNLQRALERVVRTRPGSSLVPVYRDLAEPHDRVYFVNPDHQPNPERFPPLDVFVGDQPANLRGILELRPYEEPGWTLGKARKITATMIRRVRHYEQLARAAAAAVRSDPNLGPVERLAAAEQLLTVALTFNESGRRGDEWKPLGNELRAQLFQVLLDELGETAKAQDWESTTDLARRLTAAYPDSAPSSASPRPWPSCWPASSTNRRPRPRRRETCAGRSGRWSISRPPTRSSRRSPTAFAARPKPSSTGRRRRKRRSRFSARKNWWRSPPNSTHNGRSCAITGRS